MSKRTKKLARTYNVHKKRIKKLRRHPFAIPVVTFFVLFFVTIAGFVSLGGQTIGPGDARFVNVYVDGSEQVLPTRAATVGELLKRLEVQLGEHDIVEPSVDTEIIEDDFRITVYRAKPVTITEGDKKVTLLTTHSSPDRVAQEAGFKLFPEDEVVPVSAHNALREGVVGPQYEVDRAPTIALNLYGSTVNIRVRGKTVGEVLKEKNIALQPDDIVDPPSSTLITPATKINITNPRKQIITVEETIEMPVETIDDPNAAAGSRVIKEAGTPGKKIVTYELKLENGKEVGRTIIQTIPVSEPIKQVVVKGTKVVTLTGSKAEWMAGAGISSSDYQYVDFIIGHESGWRPHAVSANRCIGLGQKCNAQSLINECPNWQTDPVCQLRHFSAYSKRHGGWSGSYTFWQNNHWW